MTNRHQRTRNKTIHHSSYDLHHESTTSTAPIQGSSPFDLLHSVHNFILGVETPYISTVVLDVSVVEETYFLFFSEFFRVVRGLRAVEGGFLWRCRRSSEESSLDGATVQG
ncbi:unnamed protein product [Lathyrus oleraceus]